MEDNLPDVIKKTKLKTHCSKDIWMESPCRCITENPIIGRPFIKKAKMRIKNDEYKKIKISILNEGYYYNDTYYSMTIEEALKLRNNLNDAIREAYVKT